MTGDKEISNTATDEVNMEGLVRVQACDWDFARQIDGLGYQQWKDRTEKGEQCWSLPIKAIGV